jgi:uncharacterized membrane protein
MLQTSTRADRKGKLKHFTKVTRSVTVNKPAEEIFGFWRKLENLPLVADNLVSVTQTTSTESHWVTKGPFNSTLEWDAEITREEKNRLLSWRTKEGSPVEHVGEIAFVAAPGGQGTEIRLTVEYVLPAGFVVSKLAGMSGRGPEQQAARQLGRFKALMEVGEVPTTEGQPVGGSRNPLRKEKV